MLDTPLNKLRISVFKEQRIGVWCPSDFRGKGGKPGYLTGNDIHPGLICLNAEHMNAALMVQLFQVALNAIFDENIVDLMNQVIEVYYHFPDSITVEIYETP